MKYATLQKVERTEDQVRRQSELVDIINRRRLLRGAFSLGALSMLTGCTLTDKSAVQSLLTAVSSFNDGVQALLFRTMATTQLAQLDLRSVALYYVVAGVLFFALLLARGLTSRSAVLALAAIFSNTLMIGVPLVQLAYGQEALALLFTLISMHALILLTLATVVLELLVAREQSQAGQGPRRHIAATVAQAVKNAILHPVPLPIIAGFLYSLTGWGLHPVVERPLKLLGDAFGPVALVLVGVTLARTVIGPHLRGALGLSALKVILHPALMAAAGWLLGLHGLPLAVMVVAAALPVGANVFLFSQRYHTEEDLVTATVAVSTVMAVGTISVVMALLRV